MRTRKFNDCIPMRVWEQENEEKLNYELRIILKAIAYRYFDF